MRKTLLVFSSLSLFGYAKAAPIPHTVDFAKVKLESAIRGSLPLELRFEIQKMYVPANVPASAKLGGLGPVPPVGPVSFAFFWDEHGKEKMVRGNANIRAFGKLTVAKNPLRHGEAITAGSVALEERDIAPYLQTGYFTDLKQAIGRQTLGSVRPGAVLGISNTQVPKLVVSGQTVDLVHKTKTLRISAKMKALENGDLDQWIRVQNMSSKRIVQARVTGMSEVSSQ